MDLAEFHKAILSRAAEHRGRIITSYAQVEHLLADIVVRCRVLPEYAKLPKPFPFRLETRIARVRQMVNMPGPLSAYAAPFEAIITDLARYAELRHFMARGLLIVSTTSSGAHLLEYRMYRVTKDGEQEGFIHTNLDQLWQAAAEIAEYAQRAVHLFHDVYLRHNLEPQ